MSIYFKTSYSAPCSQETNHHVTTTKSFLAINWVVKVTTTYFIFRILFLEYCILILYLELHRQLHLKNVSSHV